MLSFFFRFFLVVFLFLTPLKIFANESAESELKDTDPEVFAEVQKLELYNDVELGNLESKGYFYDSSSSKNKGSYSKHYTEKELRDNRKSRKTRIEKGNIVQPRSSVFFRTDIGIGCLYFSGISGNLAGLPARLYELEGSGSAPFRGSLMYNRTPLYESMLGYRFKTYFRGVLSYIHQGDITIQTKFVNAVPGEELANIAVDQLTASLELDALLLKCYVDAPWSFFWKSVMANLYLGAGVGVGWQTWGAIQVNRITTATVSVPNSYFSNPTALRLKISTNAILVADVGFRLQGSSEESFFSLLTGCKFNMWGQARNIGKQSNPTFAKLGMFKPFRIKTVYQWAPYLGVQWEFPNHVALSEKYARNTELSSLFTQMNVGVGMLYFRKIRGNLISLPAVEGLTRLKTARITGSKLTYNRTPLFEYLIQQRIGDYFQLGLSYQYQAGITIQTKVFQTEDDPIFGINLVADSAQLTSYLNLNALMLKGYVKSPLILSNVKFELLSYFGFGFGPGWQTWNRTSLQRFGSIFGIGFGGYQPIRQKISANAVLNLDFGFQATSKNPHTYFSILGGCKFNYWGQARNIGKQSQQGGYNVGLETPFTIKKMYQWAPYLGVQWNFPNNYYSKRPYYLDGRSPNTWKACFIPIGLVQKKKTLIAQMNIGIGFLYFSKIKGNLSPIVDYSPKISRGVQIKGRLTYNRTPLFDYQLGYRFNNWLKGTVSYQHQGNITVQTQVLDNHNAGENFFTDARTQLSSDLTLDALMAKCYFEVPKALVWKNYVYSPYFALGVGPSWQTWKKAVLNHPVIFLEGLFASFETSLRQKTSASVAFMFDFGFRMQTPYINSGFSALFGLKFNMWGQARNLGKYSSQLNPRNGLTHPFTIRTVYQWAPYTGVQWNF